LRKSIALRDGSLEWRTRIERIKERAWTTLVTCGALVEMLTGSLHHSGIFPALLSFVILRDMITVETTAHLSSPLWATPLSLARCGFRCFVAVFLSAISFSLCFFLFSFDVLCFPLILFLLSQQPFGGELEFAPTGHPCRLSDRSPSLLSSFLFCLFSFSMVLVNS
jgi:hypothetical protein